MCGCSIGRGCDAGCTCSCHRPLRLHVARVVEPEPRRYVASHTDSSQTLVTIFADGSGEVARRRRPTDTWGVPTSLRAEVAR